jgi:hypothetical protein
MLDRHEPQIQASDPKQTSESSYREDEQNDRDDHVFLVLGRAAHCSRKRTRVERTHHNLLRGVEISDATGGRAPPERSRSAEQTVLTSRQQCKAEGGWTERISITAVCASDASSEIRRDDAASQSRILQVEGFTERRRVKDDGFGAHGDAVQVGQRVLCHDRVCAVAQTQLIQKSISAKQTKAARTVSDNASTQALAMQATTERHGIA